MEVHRVMLFSFTFKIISQGSACQILRDPLFRTVGVTPSEANETDGLAIVTYDNVGHPDKKERIIYSEEDEEQIQLDAFMLVDRNNTKDLLAQAETHINRGGFKSTMITCVKSNCSRPNPTIFLTLWEQSMRYVVISCKESHFIYNPFEEEVLPLKEPRMRFLVRQFSRIWSNMKGTVIKVTAIQENLSFTGRRPLIGRGLDSSFLYEFARHKNFTPVVLDGRTYKFSNLQVWSHQAEFGVNSRFITIYDQKYTMSPVIYGDDICLIARRTCLRGWEVFQSLFYLEVLLCVPVVLFVTNSILSLVCRQRGWWKWLDLTTRSMFTVPLVDDIKETKERMILGGCFIFSFIFISYVQAMIYKILRTKPPVEFPSDDLVYKYVHVMKGDPYNGSSTVMRKKEYILSAQEGLIKPEDYSVKCPGYTRHFGYLLNHGTPLEPHINAFVLAVFEAGLPEAWFAKTLNAKPHYVEDDDPFKKLNIVDFEVAFFELLIGLSLSVLVFIWEILPCKFVFNTRIMVRTRTIVL